MSSTTSHERKWWKEGVVYQIYPASFKDSNGDGIGDLQGIISKLDYIHDLGIDIIWISPHFESPQVDMGYDISDYQDIYKPYGTIQDCDQLIQEVHKRGMKIIFDLVVNHSSNLHPWFLASRSSKTNPKRDWYIWRPAKVDEQGNRCPPNNWQSNFRGEAWCWDEETQEYYLHLYAEEQPDLNWENEECRREIYEGVIEFWCQRGVDGFRIDTVNLYSKPYIFNPLTGIYDLPDAPISIHGSTAQPAQIMYCNGPRMKEFLNEMNDIFEKYDVMNVGELPCTPKEEDVLRYVSKKERMLNMVFNFGTVDLGRTPGFPFRLREFTKGEFKRELCRWQGMLNGTDAWTTVFLENHDQGRSVTRFGNDTTEELRVQSGKMLAVILGTLSGTLFLYQGQEIGMVNAPRSWGVEEFKDVKGLKYIHEVAASGDKRAFEQAMEGMHYFARDHARVPMQWDDGENAGFSHGRPWMRAVDGYSMVNVKKQAGDDDSVLGFWKQLLALRKEFKDLFVYGGLRVIEQEVDLLVFVKEDSGKKVLVVANLENKIHRWSMPEEVIGRGMSLLIANKGGSDVELGPYEARVYLNTI